MHPSQLTFDRFSDETIRRSESPTGFNHPIDSWSLSDWFMAVMGELGEAANVAKKLNRVRDGINGNHESESELRLKLQREIADTLIYLNLLAQSEGFRLSEIVMETFDAKSAEIGYPFRLANVLMMESGLVEVTSVNEDPTDYHEEPDEVIDEPAD